MLIPLAMLANLVTSVTPFGGTRSDPVVVPLQGSLSGFQATSTTRWIRFETPTCTRFRLEAAFSRDDEQAAFLEGFEDRVGFSCDTDERDADSVDCAPLEFDSQGATTDVGIWVRKYRSVKLSWSSTPCPVTPVAPGLSVLLRDALFGWKSGPTPAELRTKLVAAGVKFQNDEGEPDPMGDAATLDLGGVSLSLSLAGYSAGATLSLDGCETGNDIEVLTSMVPPVLAAVGPPTLVVGAGHWWRWRAKNPYVEVELDVQECRYERETTTLDIRYRKTGGRK